MENFYAFELNFWNLLLLVLSTGFSGFAVYLIQRLNLKIEQREGTVLSGIVEEYKAYVDHVCAVPVDRWKEITLLGTCRGMVNNIFEFRKYQEGLKELLNSQIDELDRFLKEKEMSKDFKLTDKEIMHLTYLLESIKTSLPGKVVTVYRLEEEMKILTKTSRDFRKRTGKPFIG